MKLEREDHDQTSHMAFSINLPDQPEVRYVQFGRLLRMWPYCDLYSQSSKLGKITMAIEIQPAADFLSERGRPPLPSVVARNA